MKQMIIGAVALLSLVACHDDGGRRPVEIARSDSALVPVDDTIREEVTPPEEQAVRPTPRPSRKPSPAPRAPRPEPRSEPQAQPGAEASPPDTSIRVSSFEDTVPTPADTVGTPADPAAPRDSAAPEVRPPDTIGTSRPIPPRTPRPTVPSPPPGSSEAATIPAGTELHAALDDSIHSRRDSVGRRVTARVMENIPGPDGRTLVPAGATVRLTIVRLAPAASKSADDGTLELRADAIEQGGELLPFRAEVRPVPHELRGRGVTGSEAAKVGAGAAAGAIAGRVLGGNTKGAVIGGVVGAAGGAAVAAQTADRDVVVKAGTPITLVLTVPLVAGRL